MSSREKLESLLDHFDTAMLVTHDAEGDLRARPLSIAQRDSDGSLWFFTSIDSGKSLEITRDDRVAVVLQGKRRFVSITGHAQLVRERARLEELWRESFRPWFPKGPGEEGAVAVRVRPEAAEYWDLTGVAGLSYVADALGALLKGDVQSDAPGAVYHGRVGRQ